MRGEGQARGRAAALVLLVGGDSSARAALREALGPGYECREAGAAEAGLKLLEAVAFDAVVLAGAPQNMPAAELLRLSRAARPDVPVVVLLGAHEPVLATECLHAGAFACLLRPFGAGEARGVVGLAVDYRRGGRRSG